MTINERIKYFRKNILNLSQTEFASKLGMKQTSISTLERSGATVTDQAILLICTIFNLCEDWLRNGTEPMYKSQETFSLDRYAKERGMNEEDIEVIKAYFDIDPEIRRAFMTGFRDQPKPAYLDRIPDTPEELLQMSLDDKRNKNEAG